MDVVKVGLKGREYSIHIGSGCLDQTGELLTKLGLSSKALVVTDENVNGRYADKVMRSLEGAGFQPICAVLPPGENTKTLDSAGKLFTIAIRGGLDRRSPIIALGGGVIGDLTGFVAASYLRGVPFVQIPTTLLAQVDSSVGGKVAVNHPLGKNLIGAFYHPKAVVVDTCTLETLPEREMRAGLAEVVKYGVITDAAFFGFLADNYHAILVKHPDILKLIIRRSCEIKAGIVERDECESSLRMILNFGHTIGHAIEASTSYSRYIHGEAVSVGMYGAAVLSARLGLCNNDEAGAIRDLLTRFGLPVIANGCTPESLHEFLVRDKKSVGGRINWVLTHGIGKAAICNQVPDDVIRQVLEYITQQQAQHI